MAACHETEFETDQTDDRTLRFHADCYRAWKFGSKRDDDAATPR